MISGCTRNIRCRKGGGEVKHWRQTATNKYHNYTAPSLKLHTSNVSNYRQTQHTSYIDPSHFTLISAAKEEASLSYALARARLLHIRPGTLTSVAASTHLIDSGRMSKSLLLAPTRAQHAVVAATNEQRLSVYRCWRIGNICPEST